MSARHQPPIVAGRVPPHDLDAEASVLSACMLKAGSIADVADMLDPSDFYSESNGAIYATAMELDDSGKPIDIVTIATLLRGRDELARVGGSAYLAQIVDATPAIWNLRAHAAIVRDKARQRRLIAECQALAAEGYGDVGEVSAWLDEAEGRVCAVANSRRVDEDEPELPRAIIERIFKSFGDEAAGRVPQQVRVPTGLVDLDKLLKGGGLAIGGVTTMGAYWGVGKTSLALEIAGRVSMSGHRGPPSKRDDGTEQPGTLTGVMVFSLEMPKDELMERAIAQGARVDLAKDKSTWSRDEWSAATEEAQRLSRAPFWTDDRSEHTPTTIRSRLRRAKAEARRMGVEIRLVVIDYLQLVSGKSFIGKGSREEEGAYLARSTKLLARSEQVHVIAVAQLNDDASKRGNDKRPRSSDFRESKAIPMNADNCILIHNPFARARALARRDGGHADKAPEAEVVELIVDKQRGGRTGTVRALFEPAFTSFRSFDGRQYDESVDL